MAHIAVLDANTGNTDSVMRAFTHVGASVSLTNDEKEIMAADGFVVPGVGAFASVMEKIRQVHADRFIERRLAGGQAVFGICVGLQIMFEHSTERGQWEGLAQWPGTIEKLDAPIIPHMGWQHVDVPQGSALFDSVENERFYFVHSYACLTDVAARIGGDNPPLVTWAEHGQRFVSAVENGPLTAVQFHPEKSGDAGQQLLKNWMNSLT